MIFLSINVNFRTTICGQFAIMSLLCASPPFCFAINSRKNKKMRFQKGPSKNTSILESNGCSRSATRRRGRRQEARLEGQANCGKSGGRRCSPRLRSGVQQYKLLCACSMISLGAAASAHRAHAGSAPVDRASQTFTWDMWRGTPRAGDAPLLSKPGLLRLSTSH